LAERAHPDDSTTTEDEGRDAEQGAGAAEEPNGGGQPSSTSWAVRGAVVGAVAGGVTGAGLGMLFARQPNALAQARDAISGSGRHVARAAAVAAGEVMASRHLGTLLKGEADSDRGELMKQAAKEAGVAAATAARDQIITLRSDAVGAGSRGEEGGNGKR
jgi:hypothetical protein